MSLLLDAWAFYPQTRFRNEDSTFPGDFTISAKKKKNGHNIKNKQKTIKSWSGKDDLLLSADVFLQTKCSRKRARG